MSIKTIAKVTISAITNPQPKQSAPITLDEARSTLRKISDWRKELAKVEAELRARHDGEAYFEGSGLHYSTSVAWHMCDRRRRQLIKMQDEIWARYYATKAAEEAEKNQDDEWVLV